MKQSGLGRRIGLILVEKFGSSLLQLGYCVTICEIVFQFMIPSNTQRGQGLLLPIFLPLITETLGSHADSEESQRKGGSYLILTLLIQNLHFSTLTPTSSASCAVFQRDGLLLEEKYLGNGNGKLTYFNLIVSYLPLNLFWQFVTPWVIYKLYPPSGGEEDWKLIEEPDDSETSDGVELSKLEKKI